MKVIWKFTIRPFTTTVRMPRGAEILTVREQHGEPQIWALVNPRELMGDREILIVPTGGDVPEGGKFVGTFFIENGSLVFHVFDFGYEENR